jgi:hypothetical protein
MDEFIQAAWQGEALDRLAAAMIVQAAATLHTGHGRAPADFHTTLAEVEEHVGRLMAKSRDARSSRGGSSGDADGLPPCATCGEPLVVLPGAPIARFPARARAATEPRRRSSHQGAPTRPRSPREGAGEGLCDPCFGRAA